MEKNWATRAILAADEINRNGTKKKRSEIINEIIVKAALIEVGYLKPPEADITTDLLPFESAIIG